MSRLTGTKVHTTSLTSSRKIFKATWVFEHNMVSSRLSSYNFSLFVYGRCQTPRVWHPCLHHSHRSSALGPHDYDWGKRPKCLLAQKERKKNDGNEQQTGPYIPWSNLPCSNRNSSLPAKSWGYEAFEATTSQNLHLGQEPRVPGRSASQVRCKGWPSFWIWNGTCGR